MCCGQFVGAPVSHCKQYGHHYIGHAVLLSVLIWWATVAFSPKDVLGVDETTRLVVFFVLLFLQLGMFVISYHYCKPRRRGVVYRLSGGNGVPLGSVRGNGVVAAPNAQQLSGAYGALNTPPTTPTDNRK